MIDDYRAVLCQKNKTLVISCQTNCTQHLSDIMSGEVKPLQMVQNTTSCLVKQAMVDRVTPLLHWLPVATQIKLKSLLLAYKAPT